MDGQPSLWELKERFQSDPPIVEILDLLHVTPRLWTAAYVFHPGDLPAAEAFVREQTGTILAGGVKSVIHSLRSRATRQGMSAARRHSLEVICNYFTKNRDRIRYDEYLRRSYPIASGCPGDCRFPGSRTRRPHLRRITPTNSRPGRCTRPLRSESNE